ncbi:10697_t:CDS:2 [Paraglomus occultum]|uniref:10697_t:CDS:1 n=1 Tax=Paraglomus occultum TaxID=144539 RepID=A0A9N9G5T3_9GLOM|nr:10697_t:CDS:2 [Paraglomus occultum]
MFQEDIHSFSSCTGKRKNPFGDSSVITQKNPRSGMEVFEYTKLLLMAGQQKLHREEKLKKLGQNPQSLLPRCHASSSVEHCSFCDRNVCLQCQVSCERCQEVFCSYCSTIKYPSDID